MANLNLSEFGEKLFVADADHTFIWDTAASISKRVSRNSWLNSGTLTSDAPVTISQTWNDLPTVFTAFKVNAAGSSDANSASGSLLADFQLNGVSKFSVGKTGITLVGGLRTSSGALTINASNIGGVFIYGNTRIQAGSLNFNATTFLHEDAANTLALRNGAAAQTFNVYGTYTSASVYERMFMRYNGTALAFQVGAETVGATARPLEFLTAGTRKLVLTATGNNTATIYGSSNTTSNILALRNLSETAKFEFNLNASGNASFAMGSVNVISEVGNSYFNGGNVGIGTTSPTSKLQVSAGDVEVDTIAKGVILKSPDGTRYRVTVANGGTLSVAAV